MIASRRARLTGLLKSICAGLRITALNFDARLNSQFSRARTACQSNLFRTCERISSRLQRELTDCFVDILEIRFAGSLWWCAWLPLPPLNKRSSRLEWFQIRPDGSSLKAVVRRLQS